MQLSLLIKKILKALFNPQLIVRYLIKLFNKFRLVFWARVDSKYINKEENILFVDLGTNLGQGYTWFSKYFNHKNITFELFEPNPYCYNELLKLKDNVSGKIRIFNMGVGSKAGRVKFYGLNYNEGGKFSEGGTVIKNHNSKKFKHNNNLISVDIENFNDYLIRNSKLYNKIIVKMDIEGAELDLLESLISHQTIELINILYVEFHSKYQIDQQILKNRENTIIKYFNNQKFSKIRIWR